MTYCLVQQPNMWAGNVTVLIWDAIAVMDMMSGWMCDRFASLWWRARKV